MLKIDLFYSWLLIRQLLFTYMGETKHQTRFLKLTIFFYFFYLSEAGSPELALFQTPTAMIDFKTASLLKENGFPQPIKQFGQIWYGSDGLAWAIGRRFPDDPIKAICIVGTTWEHLYDTNGFVYSPTPTDIMEYLQIQVGIKNWWVLTPPLGDGIWHLSLFIAPEEVRLRFEGESAENVCLKAIFQKPE